MTPPPPPAACRGSYVGRRGDRCGGGPLPQPQPPAHPYLQCELGPRGRWQVTGRPCQAGQGGLPAGNHPGQPLHSRTHTLHQLITTPPPPPPRSLTVSTRAAPSSLSHSFGFFLLFITSVFRYDCDNSRWFGWQLVVLNLFLFSCFFF